MSTKYLYSNGYPFLDPLPNSLIGQLERIDQKKASCIIIDGAIGLGKTTLAKEAMDFINGRMGKGKVLLKIKEHPQLSLGGKEFTSCFRETYKRNLPVIAYDEAGDFNRRGAISSFNQVINRLFETYRGFKIIVIICLPNFNLLDNSLFINKIPRMLIHIKDRNMEYGNYQVYSLSGMSWIRYWYDKLPMGAKNKCYKMVQPNFYGKFKNLPPEEERALDLLSTYGKKELMKDSERKLRGVISYNEIAQKLNISLVYTKRLINELKIKHKLVQDQRKFFDKSVLDILTDRIDEGKKEV
jgi:hypothetical protein